MRDARDEQEARAQGAGAVRPATERAEELLDRTGQRLGSLAALVGLNVLRFAARAREEAEDSWAEAQISRRGERS